MLVIGQLQANAYCDNPDIVLVGTKADLRDVRDVHARQARDLADRYGWGFTYCAHYCVLVTGYVKGSVWDCLKWMNEWLSVKLLQFSLFFLGVILWLVLKLITCGIKIILKVFIQLYEHTNFETGLSLLPVLHRMVLVSHFHPCGTDLSPWSDSAGGSQPVGCGHKINLKGRNINRGLKKKKPLLHKVVFIFNES